MVGGSEDAVGARKRQGEVERTGLVRDIGD